MPEGSAGCILNLVFWQVARCIFQTLFGFFSEFLALAIRNFWISSRSIAGWVRLFICHGRLSF